MSLTSLAEEEVVRTDRGYLQARLKPLVLEYATDIVPKYKIDPVAIIELSKDLLPLAAESPTAKTSGSNALDALVKYIPTEAVTLYLAAIAVLSALKDTFTFVSDKGVYWFFGSLTPVLFFLIFVGKRRSSGLPPLPPSYKEWPFWKLFASTVAFLVWALAIPTSPYLTGTSGKTVAAFGALLVSTVLTILEPIFAPALTKKSE